MGDFLNASLVAHAEVLEAPGTVHLVVTHKGALHRCDGKRQALNMLISFRFSGIDTFRVCRFENAA